MSHSVHEIRLRVRAARQQIPLSSRQEYDLMLAERLLESSPFDQSQRIAAYLSRDGEAGTRAIIDGIWARRKQCYLPILRELPQRELWFGAYGLDSVLHPNKYGISEPPVTVQTIREPRALDLALVPLVAFDRAGNRLGMGGGYYDRSFAYRLADGVPKRPTLIGIAYECQRQECLPAQPWDVPLDGVVTERAFYLFDPAVPAV